MSRLAHSRCLPVPLPRLLVLCAPALQASPAHPGPQGMPSARLPPPCPASEEAGPVLGILPLWIQNKAAALSQPQLPGGPRPPSPGGPWILIPGGPGQTRTVAPESAQGCQEPTIITLFLFSGKYLWEMTQNTVVRHGRFRSGKDHDGTVNTSDNGLPVSQLPSASS